MNCQNIASNQWTKKFEELKYRLNTKITFNDSAKNSIESSNTGWLKRVRNANKPSKRSKIRPVFTNAGLAAGEPGRWSVRNTFPQNMHNRFLALLVKNTAR